MQLIKVTMDTLTAQHAKSIYMLVLKSNEAVNVEMTNMKSAGSMQTAMLNAGKSLTLAIAQFQR